MPFDYDDKGKITPEHEVRKKVDVYRSLLKIGGLTEFKVMDDMKDLVQRQATVDAYNNLRDLYDFSELGIVVVAIKKKGEILNFTNGVAYEEFRDQIKQLREIIRGDGNIPDDFTILNWKKDVIEGIVKKSSGEKEERREDEIQDEVVDEIPGKVKRRIERARVVSQIDMDLPEKTQPDAGLLNWKKETKTVLPIDMGILGLTEAVERKKNIAEKKEVVSEEDLIKYYTEHLVSDLRVIYPDKEYSNEIWIDVKNRSKKNGIRWLPPVTEKSSRDYKGGKKILKEIDDFLKIKIDEPKEWEDMDSALHKSGINLNLLREARRRKEVFVEEVENVKAQKVEEDSAESKILKDQEVDVAGGRIEKVETGERKLIWYPEIVGDLKNATFFDESLTPEQRKNRWEVVDKMRKMGINLPRMSLTQDSPGEIERFRNREFVAAAAEFLWDPKLKKNEFYKSKSEALIYLNGVGIASGPEESEPEAPVIENYPILEGRELLEYAGMNFDLKLAIIPAFCNTESYKIVVKRLQDAGIDVTKL